MKGDFLGEYAFHPLFSRQKVFYQSQRNRVIVIAGPTAAGKTCLSLEIARLLGGEIISADSVQVYRGMDIGTAKASLKQRMEIPHHLIDICDLSESFNVVQFYQSAVQICRETKQRGHVPIVVGGTGFYLDALLCGPPQGPPACQEIRERLEKDLEKYGVEPFYEKLCHLDPKYGATIHKADRQKIIRALEIISLSKRRVSDFLKNGGVHPSEEFDFRCWFIYFPKEILFSRIEMRCDEMIAQGFVEEVTTLIKQGLLNNPSARQAIGYRQCLEFLSSLKDHKGWEHFVWEFKKAVRRFAKRQFTWFRQKPLFHWVDLEVHGYQRALEMIIQDYESRY